MARSINDIIIDRAIRHAVFLERLQTQQVNEIMIFVNQEVIPDLLGVINRRLKIKMTKRQFAKMKKAYKKLSNIHFKFMKNKLLKNLKAIASSESKFTARILSESFPLNFQAALPSAFLLERVVDFTPIRGRLLTQWFSDLGLDTATKISQELNIGLAQGESIPTMVRRIRGTAAVGFKDGILSVQRRHIETLVRTSVNHTVTQAREETFKQNEDVIKGVMWVSTLDDRVTDICAGLDGRTFPVGEGVRPPAHHRCRSTTTSVMKSFKELGFPELKELPPINRANKLDRTTLDGLKKRGITIRERAGLKQALTVRGPAKVKFDKWLKNQTVDIQESILGNRKAQLFRSGKVKIDQFTDSRQRSLTLKQLEKFEK